VSSHLGRTDKAVLAVNGFAADGNMFVKKVRQRLEANLFLFVIPSVHR
jgi:20S proteasome alpha/beta subunit